MLYVMTEAPHTLHTLIRSFPFTYNVFLHLLLRLAVIRMQPQPDMLGLTVQAVVGDSLGFSLGL